MAPKKDVTRAAAFDPAIERVALEIEGETLELCFDFRALATAKGRLRAMGIETNILRAMDFRDLDVDTLPALLYAVASRYHPDITWEHARDLVTMRSYNGVYAALAEAYLAAVSPLDKKNPTPAAETAMDETS